MAPAERIQSYTLPTDSSSRYIPCTRYGDKENCQKPILRSIFDPIPEHAITAGPIYILTKDQARRQNRISNPRATKGDAGNIAFELQEECVNSGRVLYPVYAETDALREDGDWQIHPCVGVGWLSRFMESELSVPTEESRFYFSGRRSIHVHVPLFSSSERQWNELEERANRFCDRTGADLDTGIYQQKSQFRLPGVTHEKTGVPKTPIQPDNPGVGIAQAIGNQDASRPNTFAEVIASTFEDKARKVGLTDPEVHGPPWFDPVDNLPASVELPFTEESESSGKGAGIEDQPEYDAKEFSPYAPRRGDQRSVAIVKVRGGPFCRREVRQGTTLLPVYVYGAVGQDGEFTKTNTPAPLQLSPPDYEKYENRGFTEGDCLVVIGGLSNQSRIISIDEYGAVECGEVLTDSQVNAPKAVVQAYLEAFHDAETGGSGASTDYERSTGRSTQSELTDAQKLRRQIETGDRALPNLTHTERINVADSLLQTYGWDKTWKWFKEHYGPEFKRAVTYKNLKHLAHSYPDLSDVDVPPGPPAA